MPQPAYLDELMEPLLEAYRSSWLKVLAEQRNLELDPLKYRRRARLAEMRRSIESEMRLLDEQADDWIRNQLPKAFLSGAVGRLVDDDGSFNQINRAALQKLTTELYDELLAATSHVNDTTKRLVRKVGRDAALQKAIQGKTASQAAKEMQRILEDSGIHAVKYANGAKHGLAEYSQMAIRTTTAKAYNGGTLAGHDDVKFFEIFDGPNCGLSAHDDPRMALGMIVDRSTAESYLISHPNCRRSFGPRPDIETAKQAEEASSSVTPSQTQAQLEQDRDRGDRDAIEELGPDTPAPPALQITEVDDNQALEAMLEIEGDDTRSLYILRALEGKGEFGEFANTFVARDANGKLQGAMTITRHDEDGYNTIDYIGAQGQGTGQALVEQAEKVALQRKVSLYAEATETSESFWRDKIGMTVDPDGLGTDFYGFTVEELKRRAASRKKAATVQKMGLPPGETDVEKPSKVHGLPVTRHVTGYASKTEKRGHFVHQDGRYLGSWQDAGGGYVFAGGREWDSYKQAAQHLLAQAKPLQPSRAELRAARLESRRTKLDQRSGKLDKSASSKPPDPFASFPKLDKPQEYRRAVYSTNPGEGVRERRNNCNFAAPTMELRARGYDVIASPTFEDQGRLPFSIASDWYDPATGQSREFNLINTYEYDSKGDLVPSGPGIIELDLKKKTEDWPPGARGFMIGHWKSGGGHIWNVYKDNDGRLRYVDGQVELEDAFSYLKNVRALGVMRVDDQLPVGDRLLLTSKPSKTDEFGFNAPIEITDEQQLEVGSKMLAQLREDLKRVTDPVLVKTYKSLESIFVERLRARGVKEP